ncbi:MAG: hypothetical protein Tp1111DCM1126091_74 [Prokaryotic dsDNA virus sp.]|nr:MAG: hypothetical protein Tp1111DCM1126091_74 [Prokaryotic dsDNA virus sp.]|tara:strand:+ start:66240 stop:66413 length:174 start_codon:yes stop_codon:yes gene_type:complete
MTPESVIVTTDSQRYTLDCIEQLCVDDEHKYIQRFDYESRQMVAEEVQGVILSVVVV